MICFFHSPPSSSTKSNVYRCQILMSKDGPRTERVNVDPMSDPGNYRHQPSVVLTLAVVVVIVII